MLSFIFCIPSLMFSLQNFIYCVHIWSWYELIYTAPLFFLYKYLYNKGYFKLSLPSTFPKTQFVAGLTHDQIAVG